MKVSVTENKELLDLVKAGLRRNKELYGKSFTERALRKEILPM